MLTAGSIPYGSWGNTRIWVEVCGGYRLPRPPNVSQEIYTMLCSCWEDDPSLRPTFGALLTTIRLIDWRQPGAEDEIRMVQPSLSVNSLLSGSESRSVHSAHTPQPDSPKNSWALMASGMCARPALQKKPTYNLSQ